jgi:hypothetical protein
MGERWDSSMDVVSSHPLNTLSAIDFMIIQVALSLLGKHKYLICYKPPKTSAC